MNVNYDFLPDGYGDTLVLTEARDEIMADKLVSLVNTQRYVRHRDIWDLRWLKQQGAAVNSEWGNHRATLRGPALILAAWACQFLPSLRRPSTYL